MAKRAFGLAMAVLLVGATTAWAAPRLIEVRCDGTVGSPSTGTCRGSGLGKADFSTSLTTGSAAYSLPSGGSCDAADGSTTFTRAGDDLVVELAGVVCDMGLTAVGTVLLPNDVFQGAYRVDGDSSTGRFAGNRGAGDAILELGGDGALNGYYNGSLNR